MRRDLEKSGGVFRFKEFVENPKLLDRYLDAQVGRPWNKVFSEICSNPDCRRSIGQRVLLRIERTVATDCFMEGRQVVQAGWFGPHPPRGLYVHPKSGLLCRPRPVRYLRRTPEVTRVAIDELHWYQKVDGIWYKFDHEIRSTSWLGVTHEELVNTAKKQCSKKQLKIISDAIESGRGAYFEETRSGRTRWTPVLAPAGKGGRRAGE